MTLRNFSCLRNPLKYFYWTGSMRSLSQVSASQKFEDAVKKLASIKTEPENETKLKLYALYKQVKNSEFMDQNKRMKIKQKFCLLRGTIGKCSIPRPGMMDFIGKAKWDAWNSLQDMDQQKARENYVEVVNSLVKDESSAPTIITGKTEASSQDVISTVDGKIHKITLNRPTKKNALNYKMYDMVADSLKEASSNDSSIAVLTGSGDFYCSGNDLKNFLNVDPSEMEKVLKESGELLKRFVGAFIDFPKPLIAVVNGPAVGITVTTLALCDAVYATDKATFHTPFTLLGQTAEACSSFTFPMTMGHTKACEMLLFNKKVTAHEAKNIGLVTDVYPSNEFEQEVWKKVKEISELPPQSLRLSKSLLRENFKQTLHDVNEKECQLLVSRWRSGECQSAIMNFFQRKSMI